MALIAENLTVRFGERTVLHNFSHCFNEGVTCILGPSGCGKTTLLRALMGLIVPNEGRVICSNPNVKLSAIFQENRLCENMSAISNVRFVCPHRSKQDIERALSQVGLDGSLNLPTRDLSGGMQRRVAFVRALLADFDILFLDEPFTGLDFETQENILPFLKQYTNGKTVLIVTHNEKLAMKTGAQVLRLG